MKRNRILAALGLTLAASVALSACGSGSGATKDSSTVTLGVVGAIYEDLWAGAKDRLAQDGITLELQQFSDYTTPNNALDNGEIDLNAFQHQVFLDTDSTQNGYDIASIGYTFIIPLNLYSEKITALDQLKEGDTIGIPDDVTNGGRALKVLEAAGLITLDASAGFSPTLKDVTSYKVPFTIKELKANTIASSLPDLTAGVVNGNYALDYKLDPSKALFTDTTLDAKDYWNVIAARTEDLQDPDRVALFKKVVDAFHTEETKTIFSSTFDGYFIPVGWDADLLEGK